MKGMRKISRGSDFGGVMAYVFDGELDNPREIKGELIGGNMSGRSPKELAAEFDLSKAIRPDVKRPVWHNSLRLPAGEKIDKATWNKIGDRYMEMMGFSEHHQRCYLFDDDPKGQHIHIPASRIGLDGNLFLGKNENLKSTKVIADLEIEFGLKLTKGVNYDQAGKIVMPEKAKVSKAEMEKALRTETEPARYQLQKFVDQALSNKPTATQFVERLQASGVDVIPNIASTGKLNGFSFGLNGVYFSGSKLGAAYKYAQLEKRGLKYDQNREGEFLGQLKERARNAAEHDQNPTNADRVRPGTENRGSDPEAGRDSGEVQRVDRRANRAGDRADHADPGAAAGRVERSADERRDVEAGAEASRDIGSEAGASIAGTDAESPGTSTEKTAAAAVPAVARPGEHSHQSDGDIGAGIATGVEVSSAGLITTGDKAIDELLQAAHSGRLKAEREVLSRQKKQHAEDMANSKKRQIELDKPASNRLSQLADRSIDSAWRAVEMQRFASAMGAGKFQVTCTPANKKAETITKVYSAQDLQDPKVIKNLSHLSARNYTVSVQPSDSAGLIMLKGLDANDIKKMEAIGLAPAAVVEFAGKNQAWIATGSTMSVDERKALTKRLEAMVGVDKAAGMAGRLVGFAGAGLTAGTGQIAPAAAELLGEIKAELFEAKAAARLASTIEKTVVVEDRDFVDVGGIKDLPKEWLRDACRSVTTDQSLFLAGEYAPADVERGVIAAMARQGVSAEQANRAVYGSSSIFAGNELGAAQFVTETYTRVALEQAGRSLEGVDIQAEARKRYPDILKRAERGHEAEIEAYDAKVTADGLEESERMAKDAAQQRRINLALAAAVEKAQELDGTIKPDD